MNRFEQLIEYVINDEEQKARELLLARESKAMMPPSPLLSARMIKATYFADTIIMSDQKISERMPRTLN